jgi:hypothetical protein
MSKTKMHRGWIFSLGLATALSIFAQAGMVAFADDHNDHHPFPGKGAGQKGVVIPGKDAGQKGNYPVPYPTVLPAKPGQKAGQKGVMPGDNKAGQKGTHPGEWKGGQKGGQKGVTHPGQKGGQKGIIKPIGTLNDHHDGKGAGQKGFPKN